MTADPRAVPRPTKEASLVTTDKPLPATLAPDRRETAALGLPPCVFCGRSMTAPATIGGSPIHPDCFTRMCVATLVEGTPGWRWIPYLGWVFR